ncbi:MAG: Holliday junction resolvase RuvX [Bacteroidetes bacterium]|nr:Holliday junction resolvase RuvX [Bacteroidota bacterium]
MGRILAIDFGRKRAGIAVTDEQQIIATALTTVAAAGIMEFLKNYLSKEKVDCFVIGEPRQMNNLPSEAVTYIKPFIKRLQKEFPMIPVVEVDERFTSKMAMQTMLLAGAKKKDRQNKALLDTISATIILQSYLESRAMNQQKDKS